MPVVSYLRRRDARDIADYFHNRPISLLCHVMCARGRTTAHVEYSKIDFDCLLVASMGHAPSQAQDVWLILEHLRDLGHGIVVPLPEERVGMQLTFRHVGWSCIGIDPSDNYLFVPNETPSSHRVRFVQQLSAKDLVRHE